MDARYEGTCEENKECGDNVCKGKLATRGVPSAGKLGCELRPSVLSEVQTFVAVDLSAGVRGNLVCPANCVDGLS